MSLSTRKTVTIITSPTTGTKSLPTPGHQGARSSPTGTTAKQYRIEERKRTVYVTSDLPPSEWDAESLNTIFTMAEGVEGSVVHDEQPEGGDGIRRTHSLVETQFIISEFEENGQDSISLSSEPTGPPPDPPGPSTYYHRDSQSRRTPMKSPHSSNIPTPPGSPKRSPVQKSPKSQYLKSHPPRARILFYHKHDPYYGFTNFSAHPVMYKGKRYPTSEHLFQSFKFQGHRPNLAEHIRTCSERPSVAFSEARRFQPEVRYDWKRVNVEKMEEALWYKFTQHPDLKAELLGTGDAELIEDSDKDAFWGVGADRKGRNELGKALERLRARLRDGQ